MATRTYNNAQQQTAETGTALIKRLETGLGFPAEIRHNLMEGGLSPNDIIVVAGTCVATGVDPRLLTYRHNVPPIVKMMQWVRDYGYVPGEDFHVAVYKTNVAVPDETGTPTDQKAKAPTVVVMPSAARALTNMKEDGRLYGKTYHVTTKEVTGDEAKRIHDQEAGRDHVYVAGRTKVVKAALKTFMVGVGALDAPGEEPVFYGFFSPVKKDSNGGQAEDWLEAGKVKDNYGPLDIATKRVQTKVARYVTRSNYARDNRPVDIRVAALVDSANNRLAALEQSGKLEDAFVDGYADADVEIEATTPSQHAEKIAQMPVARGTEVDDLIAFAEAATGAVVTVLDGPDDFIDAVAAVVNAPPDPYKTTMGRLWEAVPSDQAELITTLRAMPAEELKPVVLGLLLDHIRGDDLGGWTAGENYAGLDKAELIARFVLGAERDEELGKKPAAALFKKAVKAVKTKEGLKTNLGFDERYHVLLWHACTALNELCAPEEALPV